MKNLISLAVVICCVQCYLTTAPYQIDDVIPTLKQTFAEEFNSFSMWNGASGTWQTSYPWGTRTNNDEFEYYSDSTVGVNPFSVTSGVLKIQAKPGTGLPKGPDGRTLNYTSGFINSSPSFSQKYGYFEMRAQLPIGAGMFPSFWLLPTDFGWPPEIDILQAFGAPHSGYGYNNQFHYGISAVNSSANFGNWVTVSANITNAYHRYGCLWTNTTLAFYFDNVKVGSGPTPAGFNKTMYIVANLAVGGAWAGPPTAETANMYIDYIRVYSLDQISTLSSIPKQIGDVTPFLKNTFVDNFNTFSMWNGASGTWQTTYPWGSRTNNDEFEYYSDSTVGVNPFSVSSGILTIQAKPGTGLPKGPDGRSLNYTSGIITSYHSFTQTYGYFEISTKLPIGAGMWPAFWLLPTDLSWPPEIDILEAFGAPNQGGGYNNQYHYQTHATNSANNFGDWATFSGVNITSAYHQYGCLWTNTTIAFYFDGNLVVQGSGAFPEFQKPMYILANLAVGGSWPGPPKGETGNMYIDYIKAWSLQIV